MIKEIKKMIKKRKKNKQGGSVPIFSKSAAVRCSEPRGAAGTRAASCQPPGPWLGDKAATCRLHLSRAVRLPGSQNG